MIGKRSFWIVVKGLWLTITDATFVVTRCKYTIKIHFLTLFLVTNSFCFISFLLICFNMWVNVAFSTKKVPHLATQHLRNTKTMCLILTTIIHLLNIRFDLVVSPTTYLMHLVVNLDNGLWNWPVLILTLYELELDTSISEWVMNLIIELVRILTYYARTI